MSDPASRTAHDAGDWRPCAAPELLRLRARLLAATRAFFAERGVLEVETPVLSAAANPDPHVEPLATRVTLAGGDATLYLHTSPELAMKRLLAAGSGPIYQIARVFRDGEQGRLHNPEFTMLEWYRPGFDHHRLMDETGELVSELTGWPAAERTRYREAFLAHAGVDPFVADDAELAARAAALDAAAPDALAAAPRGLWLDLLFSHLVLPRLGGERPVFVYDFPAAQAALARVREGAPAVAERFELVVRGIEIANGFHELGDAAEQRERFARDLACRRAAGRMLPPIDERMLAALTAGLPACAGVALGFDRLLMLVAGRSRVADVLAFPIERA